MLIVNECKRARCTDSKAISDTSNVHTFTFLHLHVIIVALDTTLQRHSQRRTYRDRTINRVWQGDRQTMDIWRI
ncbi:uncharacterized protein PHALS_10680 [Plasmopara halstedii]|uniref:Uncharacterized protein n=1 Tax=Plasmopara halstedii TaxID=4781 RepID=A0A0P1AIF2_PLAHL|nr:uncharacterized protein PHALS_10680 [Plasmopara halstedii]CEG40484.1 hypothetical protein PHALS_10680 [Plasmopara halstedii]|eukprot:XP_024576853.1 hypothetical protein PHALS_10680 [Plasmopara halstedii]